MHNVIINRENKNFKVERKNDWELFSDFKIFNLNY